LSDALLAALSRRFSSQAALLPGLLPALTSDDPTPFLARYRADVLQGLPEAAFRKLRQAAREEHELSRRRQGVRRLLEQAGALTEDVAKVVEETADAALLEDVARPLRAAKAADAEGRPAEDPMRPVARRILAGEAAEPLETLLAPFCGEGGASPTVADQRVRLVRLVADLMGDDPEARRAVRASARRTGELVTSLESRKEAKPVYKPFADMRRAASKVPARTLLLLRRGQKTGAVRVKLAIPDEERAALLAGPLEPREGHPSADLVREAAKDALDRVLLPAAANELMKERKRAAERSLLPLFAQALREKLLTAPAGRVPVVAVVPGATGTCRIAVVDAEGRPGATVAVHPLPPRNEKEEAAKAFADLVRESRAKLVAVAASGRARALREWAVEVLASNRELGAVPVFINETAAVAWSESESGKTAEPEHPATVRAAHSLGRCLQDPLAEALRYDLCEIPIGPNAGDVDQGELRRRLEETAEACVALVGADVNTAPAALLARVPGLDAPSAAKIVAWREANGPFATRADVRRVEGLDELAWQRAAGFLRIRGGADVLEATGVHPTGAMIVPAIAAKLSLEPHAVVGRADLLEPLDPKEFAGPVLTEGDVRSVLAELAHGTADPRGAFVAPAFNPGVGRAKDLAADMEMDGVVTNVSKFGAFVDVGVGQDGLVHVSEMSHDYVRDPADVVQVGQKVRVKVLAVDSAKRRISLSIKALLPVPERPPEQPREERPRWGGRAEGAPGAAERGPRRPPSRRPEGAPQAGQGAGPRRDGRGERGPGGFFPERPGTAPRRAQGRGRFGRGKDAPRTEDGEVDLSRDSGTGSFRDLTGGRGGRRFERPDRPERPAAPPRRAGAPSELDPFQQQLAALRSQLGIVKPEAGAPPPSAAPAAPPTDPPADGERPTA
jgi:protein Tex